MGKSVGAKKTITYIAGILIFALLLSLGFWQLSRMNEKKQLEMAWEKSLSLPPLTWQPQDPLPRAYTQIAISGQLQSQYAFVIDNQFDHQVRGYHVIAPLLLADKQSLVLINLGWVPQNEYPITPICQQMIFDGWVMYPDEKRFILGDNLIASEPQLILQRMDFTLLQQNWKTPVQPFMLLLNPDHACGFVREWSLNAMTSTKHLGYAVQWFALSLCFVILFIKFIHQRKPS